MEIGGKKLVAKVDAKTQDILDEYKGEFLKICFFFVEALFVCKISFNSKCSVHV